MSHRPSQSALKAAALDFLSTDVFAIEATAARKLDLRLQAVIAGTLDGAGLRAALGGERSVAPTQPPRGGVKVVELVGVLTPHESIFTWLGLGTSMRSFIRDLTAAAADPTVRSIFVYADSPGGSVSLIPEADALVRQVRSIK